MNFNLATTQNILIIGGGHGIGLAIVQNLIQNNRCIYVSYRDSSKAQELLQLSQSELPNNCELIPVKMDPTDESEIQRLAQTFVGKKIKLDLIINCVGLLHNKSIYPEKSLKDFQSESFLEVMRVNTIVTPLIAKYFKDLFCIEKVSALVTLSAKLGSISDNQMGGWHSYRASKAALNMLIKNIHIEFQRQRKKILLLAIHPGTTETELSQKFIQHTSYKIHTPPETAENILSALDGLNFNESGSFLSWDGKKLPW